MSVSRPSASRLVSVADSATDFYLGTLFVGTTRRRVLCRCAAGKGIRQLSPHASLRFSQTPRWNISRTEEIVCMIKSCSDFLAVDEKMSRELAQLTEAVFC